jgi:mitochondrial-processing peptidase subunit beta
VKHEDIVEQATKLFDKLSTDPTTTSMLVAKEPASFTGSEVCFATLTGQLSVLLILIVSFCASQ